MPGSNAVDLPPADGLQSIAPEPSVSGVRAGGPVGSDPTDGSLLFVGTAGSGGSGSTATFGGASGLTDVVGSAVLVGLALVVVAAADESCEVVAVVLVLPVDLVAGDVDVLSGVVVVGTVLDWVELDWVELDWVELDWVELGDDDDAGGGVDSTGVCVDTGPVEGGTCRGRTARGRTVRGGRVGVGAVGNRGPGTGGRPGDILGCGGDNAQGRCRGVRSRGEHWLGSDVGGRHESAAAVPEPRDHRRGSGDSSRAVQSPGVGPASKPWVPAGRQ